MSIRALIVDDEELARRGLRARLERAGVTIAGECVNGADALAAIPKVLPDLVFLDIQMPELSGLGVAAAMDAETRPHVIFVTAFDQYAVQAFEVHALDYILKPIDDQRLATALAHARSAVRSAHDSDFGRRVTLAIASMRPDGARAADGLMPDRLLVRTGGRIVVIRVADVDWIEASGDYASVHVEKKAWLIREGIAAIAQRYAMHGIVRIHRSTLVNLDRVTQLRPLSNGEFTLILRDGTELKMSRNFRDALNMLGGGATPL
jgi:two-component system, LytTR family, response regulator